MSAEGGQVAREPNWETKNLRAAEVLGDMAVLVIGQEWQVACRSMEQQWPRCAWCAWMSVSP